MNWLVPFDALLILFCMFSLINIKQLCLFDSEKENQNNSLSLSLLHAISRLQYGRMNK